MKRKILIVHGCANILACYEGDDIGAYTVPSGALRVYHGDSEDIFAAGTWTKMRLAPLKGPES